MRIAVVTHSFLPTIGGAEIVVHNVALEHHRAGHFVALVPNLGSMSVARHLPYRCVPMWRREWTTAAEDGAMPDGRARLRRGLRVRLHLLDRLLRPDIWHVHSVYPAAWAVIDIIHEELDTPVAVTSHGSDIFQVAAARSGINNVDSAFTRTLQRADELIAVGPGVVESYQRFGIPADDVELIRHGWDPERTAEARSKRAATRVSLGIEDGELLALAVAADRPVKRLDDLLDVAAGQRPSGPWRWAIVSTSERLASEIDRRELSDRVRLIREPPLERADLRRGLPRQGILELYAAADVLVVPSERETSPAVIHEALASGIPVVATEPGAAGLITNGIDGILVPLGDIDALRSALDDLAVDRELLAALARRAGSHRDTLDDWKTVASRHRARYASAIERWGDSPAGGSPGPSGQID